MSKSKVASLFFRYAKNVILLSFFISKICFARSMENSCRDWKGKDWDNYLQKEFFRFNSNPRMVLSSIGKMKLECAGSTNQANLNACTQRALDYFSQFANNSDEYMYSSVMKNDEYIASQPKGVLELPKEFQNASNGLPSNWEDIAKKNGWKWVLFHSDTANEPRLVFYIPGEKYDRMLVYYSFNTKDTSPSSWVGLQMQAVQRKTDDGKVPELLKYYFKSWEFSRVFRKPEVAHTGGRCVQCHISGPRAIIPINKPAFETRMGGVQNIEEFNRLIVQKGELDYSPYYNMKAFPKHLQIGSDCVQCHDGKDRQSLAFSVDSYGQFELEKIHRKVVREESMPMELYESLNQTDRLNITRSIASEYKRKLQDWVTEVSCETGKAKVRPNSTVEPAKSGTYR